MRIRKVQWTWILIPATRPSCHDHFTPTPPQEFGALPKVTPMGRPALRGCETIHPRG
jgi:hypothetical protein